MILLLALSMAWAQEPQSVSSPEPAITPSVEVKRQGKRSREKETEGTQALDRFEAHTVGKSQYQLGGQPLEVDPD